MYSHLVDYFPEYDGWLFVLPIIVYYLLFIIYYIFGYSTALKSNVYESCPVIRVLLSSLVCVMVDLTEILNRRIFCLS